MAVSEWSTNPTENTKLNGYSLSGPYGHVFAVLMAEIKSAIEGVKDDVEDVIGEWTTAEPVRTTTVKAAIEALEGHVGAWVTADTARTDTVCEAVEAVEAGIGAWTDGTETTTVKAAIEALRPEPEATT